MSKAFTKDVDDAPPELVRRRGVPVPTPNPVTAPGLASARAEHDALARTGGDPDRLRELGDHLATAQVIPPEDLTAVGVGARVAVDLEDGTRVTYEIVGAIEADAKHGRVSWQAPLAQALWGAHVGDAVVLPRGGGEIVALTWLT